jgi:O-antigen/teichoic acid export membrane protein
LILIGRKDIIWNYAATFLKIASSALLLPFILRMMPSETVGIWSVFMTVSAFAGLLDFGFNPSFTRNITYIFSGVRTLKVKSFEPVSKNNQIVDYDLLKGVIGAMRWFYFRMAIILLLLLSTMGTYYIYLLLKNYTGDHREVYFAWSFLCATATYNLFTQYYDSLLQGKGLVKESKQIIIIGQSIYLIIASLLIISGCSLVAIVSAQALSVITIRRLSNYVFFNRDIKLRLKNAVSRSKTEILKVIYPNAIKIGLTSLGGFMVQKSAIVIGSMYLSLKEIASYGITLQLITVIAGFAGIYTLTYQPKIAELRVEQNNLAIKEIYLKGEIVLIFTYLALGFALIIFGKWAFKFIESRTLLLPQLLLFASIVVSFLESNHSLAGTILLSKNEVPFFKASLCSGGATIILMMLLFQYTNLNLWSMIAAPGIVQGVYQNWKWPSVVFAELKIDREDIFKAIRCIKKM